MKHFICTGGCDGESSTPGVCQAEGCENEGAPLVPCDCGNGLHREVEEKHEQQDEE
jgi:hypothetical protein